jgi:hypothetical protein
MSEHNVPAVRATSDNTVVIHRNGGTVVHTVAYCLHGAEAIRVAAEIRGALADAFLAGVERGEEIWS